jgi:hypothetical protein
MSYFEAVNLPDASKRAMCLELLEEFGASIKRVNDKNGEITHGCLVSPGMHSDQDRNPTAGLNYLKLTYNCLGCQASGGLLWFIATCRGETSQAARQWLEQTAGLGSSVMELEAMLRFLDNMYATRNKPPIPSYSDRALNPWDFVHPYFTDPFDPHPDRGGREIPLETYRKFRLGWDPEKDRVVLPHFWKGKLVGWQTRKMPFEYLSKVPEPGQPKYHSSPDFPKDSTIFNYEPKASTAVVVESMMSVLRHIHKIHMEGTFGASVTDLQVRLLVKHEICVLFMDPDKAGWRAVEGQAEEPKTKTSPGKERIPGMAEQLAPYCDVRVVDSPWQQDAGDLPTDEVVGLAASAVPWSLWKRPEVLYCFYCRQRAHQGPCSA